VLVPGNVKQVRQLARGARGWGWFKLFKEKGNDGFRKAHPPTPFDWEADAEGERKKAFLEVRKVESSVRQGSEPDDRGALPHPMLQLTVDGVAAGRLELELANDLLPITCENFVRCVSTQRSTLPGLASRDHPHVTIPCLPFNRWQALQRDWPVHVQGHGHSPRGQGHRSHGR
ncbi:unnamed protein product, partial [Chrysoparadoxa australica]